MQLSERARQLIPKSRIINFRPWATAYDEEAIALFQTADDEVRYLNDDDLNTLSRGYPSLTPSLQAAKILRDNAKSIVDSARQSVLQEFPTITAPRGDLYPPHRAEACWRDFWNFLRCITYGIAGQQIPYTSPEGLENMRLLYQELQVPFSAMIWGLEGLKRYGIAYFSPAESPEIEPYFEHLIEVMQRFQTID
jgi:allophycocyanin-B